MFSKEAETTTGHGSLNTILGQGSKFKGEVELKGTIRVDGEFDGKIDGPDTLIIGKSGVVKANVVVKNAIIGGKLQGNIVASNKIELQTGSHVQGDIETVRLVIDEGVFFEGNCRMGASSKPKQQQPPAERSFTKSDEKPVEAAATR